MSNDSERRLDSHDAHRQPPRPPELLDRREQRQDGEGVDPDEWDATVADAEGAEIATERIY